MPIYTFRNKNNGQIEEHNVPLSDLDSFKEKNPHLSVAILKAPGVTYGGLKVPDGFKDRLREIKKDHPHAKFEIP